jgi:hypothetical protein
MSKKKTKYKIHKSTEELTGTKIKYGSATYTLLCFAEMKSRMKQPSFSLKDVVYVISGKITRNSDAKKSINILISAGCLEQVSDGKWKITDFGIKTRKIFGSYGSIASDYKLELNRRRSLYKREEIGWEDQTEIIF